MNTPVISRREEEVLAALAGRLTNAEIAGRLFISVRTVETHVSALLRKFGVQTRRDLADIARARMPTSTAAGEANRPRLPSRLTSFLGRDEELSALRAALTERRLVTVTGPAGVGKTRLAIEVAAALTLLFASGAWFVDLTRATGPAELIDAAASALAVEDVPGTTLRRSVFDRLAQSPARLLVLDNCEHVVAAVAEFVGDVLETCDTVTILATSRERLALAGEQVFPLAPLADESAARLFADRAQALDPTFRLDRGSGQAVASICRRLDGMPLAIELAAAQIETLTPEQIDGRLADRFAVLRAPRRGGPARHEALGAALEWSYELLRPAERALLDRLAVFRGRFDADAARVVAAGPPAEDVAGLLASLVRKSLVLSEQVGEERRFRLLESVREYGSARLSADGELSYWRDRHLDWVLALLADAGRGVASERQAWWFGRLDEELPNIETALEWTMHNPVSASRALPALQGLRTYWLGWGMQRAYGGTGIGAPLRPRTGARWLEAAAVAATTAGPAVQARALVDAVNLVTLADLPTAGRLADAAGDVAGGDAEARPYADLAQAFIRVFGPGPDPEAAARSAADALAPSDLLHWWARALLGLNRARRGQPAEAAAQLHAVSKGFAELGDDHLAGGWIGWAADLTLAAGDPATARAENDVGSQSARRFGCASCECQVLSTRALLDVSADPATRLGWAREAVRLAHAIGETWSVLGAIEVTVAMLSDAHLPAEAALLSAAVEALRVTTGFVALMPGRAAARRRGRAAARDRLGAEGIAILERDGAALDYEAAVALALS